MSLPPILQHLRIPVVASPMFIVSGPDLVIAQCKAGIVGSFPALNARPAEALCLVQKNLPVSPGKNPRRLGRLGPAATSRGPYQAKIPA